MKRFLLILIVLGAFSGHTVTADPVPVMLMLRSSVQSDTSGCNFVEELTELIYNEIMDNKVTLWDSRSMEIRISPSTLLEIEKNSGVGFKGIETLFIYETWETGKKEISTKTLGFSFTHRSETGDVSFGYVNYQDIEKLLLSKRINTNANGIYNSTYTTYVLGKKYAFNIVQFNGQQIKSQGESDDILKTYVRGLPFNSTLLGYYPPDKFVSSIIDTYMEVSDPKADTSKMIVKAIENYLTQNEEEFYNMGGDKITSYLQKNKLKVTRVEVNEMWRKLAGELKIETRSITIYVNDSALKTLSAQEFANLNISIADRPLSDLFAARNYNYIITKINAQEIRRQDSYIYQRALLNAEWNRVIEYVLGF
ncbi:MAG TPA: hypothetical protein VFW78_07105 [Bacteroidia bacterium]|nr:hypothetical protein [Bacteroidia bacterium]